MFRAILPRVVTGAPLGAARGDVVVVVYVI